VIDDYKPRYYALIERKVVPMHDLMQWAKWFELARKNELSRIGQDEIGESWVSTVFLGLDHGFAPWDGPEPVLFETMVFMNRGEYNCDQLQWRYRTIEQAEAGHKAAVEWMRKHQTDAEEKAETLIALLKSEVFANKGGEDGNDRT
jgi:hypothetical protein